MSSNQYPALTKVSLEGLFDEHDIAVELFTHQEQVEPRLRILFDENGRGKTTVLRSIYHLMSWSDMESHFAALAEIPLEGIELLFGTSGKLWFRRAPDDPAICTVGAHQGNESATFEFDAGRFDPRKRRRIVAPSAEVAAYRNLAEKLCLSPILVADDRTIRSDDLMGREYHRRQVMFSEGGVHAQATRDVARAVDPSAELAVLLEQISLEFRRETFGRRPIRTEAVYASVVRRILEVNTKQASGDVEAMLSRALTIREALTRPAHYNLTDLSQLDEVIETLSVMRKNHQNRKTVETVLDPYFTNLEAEIDRLTPGADRIHRFVSTVNSFLTEKEMEFSLSDGLVVTPTSPVSRSPLEPSQLSSGERHLLLLLGSAMLARHDRLILIDEPELSLGIPWKRTLLDALLTLTTDSSARFLVASHSVEIITPYHSAAVRLRQPTT